MFKLLYSHSDYIKSQLQHSIFTKTGRILLFKLPVVTVITLKGELQHSIFTKTGKLLFKLLCSHSDHTKTLRSTPRCQVVVENLQSILLYSLCPYLRCSLPRRSSMNALFSYLSVLTSPPNSAPYISLLPLLSFLETIKLRLCHISLSAIM